MKQQPPMPVVHHTPLLSELLFNSELILVSLGALKICHHVEPLCLKIHKKISTVLNSPTVLVAHLNWCSGVQEGINQKIFRFTN